MQDDNQTPAVYVTSQVMYVTAACSVDAGRMTLAVGLINWF